jgi:hypothetical protein
MRVALAHARVHRPCALAARSSRRLGVLAAFAGVAAVVGCGRPAPRSETPAVTTSVVTALPPCGVPNGVKMPSPADSTAVAARAAPAAPAAPALREELLAMERVDQEARVGFGPASAAGDTAFARIARRMMEVDSAHTVRLRAIVAGHGWPGPSLVGADGAEAAWLLLQHSPSLELQRAVLPQLWAAARRGEVRAVDAAMLTDRVLRRSGRPQCYGNAFSLVNGRLVQDTLEDPAHLDARRAALGLPPMAEYVRVLGEGSRLPVEWPPARRP